jgi:hypothetical protein
VASTRPSRAPTAEAYSSSSLSNSQQAVADIMDLGGISSRDITGGASRQSTHRSSLSGASASRASGTSRTSATNNSRPSPGQGGRQQPRQQQQQQDSPSYTSVNPTPRYTGASKAQDGPAQPTAISRDSGRSTYVAPSTSTPIVQRTSTTRGASAAALPSASATYSSSTAASRQRTPATTPTQALSNTQPTRLKQEGGQHGQQQQQQQQQQQVRGSTTTPRSSFNTPAAHPITTTTTTTQPPVAPTATQQQRPRVPRQQQSTSHRATALSGMMNESQVDAQLAQDPCVLRYNDVVSLRSQPGSYLCCTREKAPQSSINLGNATMARQSAAAAIESAGVRRPRAGSASSMHSTSNRNSETVIKIHASGNPIESGSAFMIVGTSAGVRGPIKHGQTVALCSVAEGGRYLGAYAAEDNIGGGLLTDDRGTTEDDETIPFVVALKRKMCTVHDQWQVVQVPNTSSLEQQREERQRRVVEENRAIARAQAYGGSHERARKAARDELAKRAMPLCVRSGGAIALRSVFAQNMYLCVMPAPCLFGDGGQSATHMQLVLLPGPHSNSSSSSGVGLASACQWTPVLRPAPFVPEWSRERPFLVGEFQHVQHSAREAMRAASASVGAAGTSQDQPQGRQQLLRNASPVDQEDMLVEDMLFALQGIEGNYICCRPDDDADDDNDVTVNSGSASLEHLHPAAGRVRSWSVDPNCGADAALMALMNRMMPLCAQYVHVSAFTLK